LVFGIAVPLALLALALVWRLEERKLGEEVAKPPTPIPSRPAIGAAR